MSLFDMVMNWPKVGVADETTDGEDESGEGKKRRRKREEVMENEIIEGGGRSRRGSGTHRDVARSGKMPPHVPPHGAF